MKAIFVLQETDGIEILDPKNNIERLRRIRSIDIKQTLGSEWKKVKRILSVQKRYKAA